MKTVFAKPASVERKWYIIDAEGMVLGRVAAAVATIVRGKNKAIFVPHQEIGDFVIVINADKVKVTGRKAKNKVYYKHSGFAGGLKASNYDKLIARHPTKPLELAVKGMLPKGPLGRKLLKNAKLYAGSEHPHTGQMPINLTLSMSGKHQTRTEQ